MSDESVFSVAQAAALLEPKDSAFLGYRWTGEVTSKIASSPWCVGAIGRTGFDKGLHSATNHRGQAAAKLKRFGIERRATDYFSWVIEQIPHEA